MCSVQAKAIISSTCTTTTLSCLNLVYPWFGLLSPQNCHCLRACSLCFARATVQCKCSANAEQFARFGKLIVVSKD